MAEAEATGSRRLTGGAVPPFEAFRDTYRKAARDYRSITIVLLAGGVVIGVAGLASAGVGSWLASIELVMAIAAAVPWKKSLEHRGRADGVEVLDEGWWGAAAAPSRRAQLLGRIRHLYA